MILWKTNDCHPVLRKPSKPISRDLHYLAGLIFESYLYASCQIILQKCIRYGYIFDSFFVCLFTSPNVCVCLHIGNSKLLCLRVFVCSLFLQASLLWFVFTSVAKHAVLHTLTCLHHTCVYVYVCV